MTTKINYRRAFAGLLLGGLFLTVQTASAQIWSSAGSTCTPDEDTVSAGLYDFTNGTFQFNSGKTGSIKARCHVINPMGRAHPRVGIRSRSDIRTRTARGPNTRSTRSSLP